MPGRSFSSPSYRYGFNAQEKDDEVSGSGNTMTAEFWEYDSRLGRRWNLDPIIKFNQTAYGWVTNNPILYSDPIGSDSMQRAKAIVKGQEYVSKKKDGNQYGMGKKGLPGDPVDCSGLVSECVKAGDETDPNHGNLGSGVLQIEANTTSVNPNNIIPGNLVTFRNDAEGAYPYHVALISEVIKDANNNVTQITIIQSSGGVGPNTVTISTTTEYAFKKVRIFGYYKWDTKPDSRPETSMELKMAYKFLQSADSYSKKGANNLANMYKSFAEDWTKLHLRNYGPGFSIPFLHFPIPK